MVLMLTSWYVYVSVVDANGIVDREVEKRGERLPQKVFLEKIDQTCIYVIKKCNCNKG